LSYCNDLKTFHHTMGGGGLKSPKIRTFASVVH
jgi:hypothetical protein